MGVSLLLSFLVTSLYVYSLKVEFSSDYTSYAVTHKGTSLFSGEGQIAAFVDGKWHAQSTTLKRNSAKKIEGTDPGLGHYSGKEINWSTGKTTLITRAKTYGSGYDVSFEYSFPDGASGTSTVEHAGTNRDEVIVNFPAFTTVKFPNELSWEGSFVGARTSASKGPTGGPTVFFDRSDLQLVVVGSALNNFKSSSAGPGKTWNGKDAWVPGTSGTIRKLPNGFTQTFLLHMGTQPGITNAIAEWGELLQTVYQTKKIPDITLQKIGYQTDNGAMYCFCQGNCTKTLLDEMDYLRSIGVPMGYLSFQGSGASKFEGSNGNAPWCVHTWGPDGGLGGNYPVNLKDFQKALGLPLQLYAPYFCPGSIYFDSKSNWTAASANTSLEGCNNFGFDDVTSSQSRAFYDWFFAKGVDVGMVSFEPDFMNQNYNCVPEFIHDTVSSMKWMHGMADAALAKDLTVQWCYATPTDVLASLDMPAVTNFRVSRDFCYGNSWNVGVSSLLVWALGSYPSKDTLWTTTNKHTAIPGCNWSPDHEIPAAELHVVIALMTTGPVGISDSIGQTNAVLIKRSIAGDGTLLKPSKALTSVDSAVAGSSNAPSGFVYSSYSGESKSDVLAYYFVSFKLKKSWDVGKNDFWPPIKGSNLIYRRFLPHSCENNTAATNCITHTTASDSIFKAPKSDFTNTTGGTDLAPAVTTVWPLCTGGWTLLGDLSKYVALSTLRFRDVKCTSSGVSATITGTPREIVPVTLLQPKKGAPNSNVFVLDVVIPSSGSAKISFPQ